MTKGEQLKKLQKQAKKVRRRKAGIGKLRVWAVTGLLAAGTAVGINYGMDQTTVERQTAYNLYRQSPDVVATFESLDYEDTFDIWNSKDLGNDVNVLLTGGSVYVRNQYKMLPSGDGTTLVIVDAAGNETALDVSASFLNVVGNTLYFRNDADRSIYAYDLPKGEVYPVVAGSVGEVFVTNDAMYFIDYNLDSTIQAMILSGTDKKCVVASPVSSFVVCGNYIIYLDTHSDLYYAPLNLDANIDVEADANGDTEPSVNEPKKLVGNIERFMVGDRIYVESKNTIFSFTPTGGDAREEYTSTDNSLRLVGYLDGHIFFQEGGRLRYLSDGADTTICYDSHSHYTSPVADSTGTLYTVAYTPETGQEVLKLAAIPESGGIDDGE